ncbi:hypothetical protein J5751_04880 [bacterium]|nr:hypothetical protein [bacterium]
MAINENLWGKFNTWAKDNKGLAFSFGLSSIATGIGSIMMANAMKSNVSSSIAQMKENAKINAENVSNLMSNNALSYLKNGVGISGSALEVINQNATNGMERIENELSYERAQLRDSIRSVRNQSFMSLASTFTNIGFMFGK